MEQMGWLEMWKRMIKYECVQPEGDDREENTGSLKAGGEE
jgi:hypothetical protein